MMKEDGVIVVCLFVFNLLINFFFLIFLI